LWAFYQGRIFPATDQIFPTFIIDRMPPGLVGLIIAAVVAATMSTHSGAINSLAAATTHDIYLPLTRRAADAPETLKMGKLFALIWGVVLTAGALAFPQETNTPVVVVALGIASFTYGGLLGGFFLGVFWSRANQRDAIIGMSIAIATMAFIVFAKPISAAYPSLASTLGPFASIAWPWYVLIGTAITLAVGMLSSLTHPLPVAAAVRA
jgi:solute:Na+ symporter, SSS family